MTPSLLTAEMPHDEMEQKHRRHGAGVRNRQPMLLKEGIGREKSSTVACCLEVCVSTTIMMISERDAVG
jgi:hypothetical protein